MYHCSAGDLRRKPSAKVVPFDDTTAEEEKQHTAGGAGGAGGDSVGMKHVTSNGSLHSEDMDQQNAGMC